MTNLPHDDAETIFATWAERAEAGEARDFSDVIAEHPNHADALQLMHADWLLFAPILMRVVPGLMASQTGLPDEMHAASIDDSIQPVSSELIERLGIQLPDAGRYRFRGVLGRGGGGVVLRVWDQKLHRALAMKVVLGRGEAEPTGDTPQVDAAMMTRFVDEARISSQLDHPGIVPVHELGTDATGRAFFTMRLVKGEDLSKIFVRLRAGSDEWTQVRALGVMAKVCEAVAFAHEKGVVHRDLKPANVMVGRHGEVHVMDWGLARVLGSEIPRTKTSSQGMASQVDTLRRRERSDTPNSPLLTRQGSILGTPAYMSPEQARGDLECVDARSDVYAIGAMLYELIAGVVPFVPAGAQIGPEIILMRVLEGPPQALAKLAPKAPPELVAICEKAMERKPEQRYADVRTLERDLRAYLERKVVKAYETGTWAETRKWVRRNRALAVALVGFFVVLCGGVIVSSIMASKADRQAIVAQQREGDALEATAAKQELLRRGARDLFQEADRLFESAYSADTPLVRRNHKVEGLLQLVRSLEFDPELGVAWERLALEIGSLPGPLRAEHCLQHDGPVVYAEFSPDDSRVVTASEDGTVWIWDSATGKRLLSLLHPGRVSVARFSPDGTRVLSVSGTHAWLWEGSSGELLASLPHDDAVNAAIFNFDASLVATASEDGGLNIWNAKDGSQVASVVHAESVSNMWFHEDGRRLVAAPEFESSVVWDYRSETGIDPIPWMKGQDYQVVDVSGDQVIAEDDNLNTYVGSIDGSAPELIFSGSYLGSSLDRSVISVIEHTGTRPLYAIHRYDAKDGMLLDTLELDDAFKPFSSDCLFGADHTQVTLSLGEGSVIFLGSSLELSQGSPITKLCFDSVGSRLLTASLDGSAGIWNLARNEGLGVRFHRPDMNIGFVSFTPDMGRVIEVGWDHGAKLWDAARGIELGYFWQGGDGNWKPPVFFPDGTFLASGNRILHPDETGLALAQQATVPKHDNSLCRESFTTDGSLVVTTDAQTAIIWDLLHSRKVATFSSLDASITEAVISPDGSRVVTMDERNKGSVWDTTTQSVVADLEGPFTLNASAFAPSGKELVTVEGRVAVLWDLSSGERLGEFVHDDQIYRASFHPRGGYLLTNGDLNHVSVWNLRSGLLEFELQHPHEVGWAEYSPDGEYLATCSLYGSYLWDAASGARLLSIQDSARVTHARFSADSRRLVTCSSSWSVNLEFTPSDAKSTITVIGLSIGRDLRNCARASDVPAMRSLVRYLCGSTRNERGHLTRLSYEQLREEKEAVHELSNRPGPLSELARWILATGPNAPAHPGSQVTRRERADVLLAQGAESRAFELDPSHPLRYFVMANREPNEARKASLRRLGWSRMPADAELWTRAAQLLLDGGDIQGSHEAASRALVLDPAQVRAQRLKAIAPAEAEIDRVLAFSSDLEAAAAILREAQGIPEDVRQLALERLSAREALASDWYWDLVRSCPLESEIRAAVLADVQHLPYMRAYVLERLAKEGDQLEQLRSYAWSFALQPPSSDPTLMDRALRCARRAVELAPNDAKALCTLGAVEYRLGAFAEAEAHLNRSDILRAEASEERTREAIAFLAMTLHALGKVELAQAQLRELEARTTATLNSEPDKWLTLVRQAFFR